MLPLTDLTDDDYSAIAHLQHARLQQYYPALQQAAFLTRADATLTIICDTTAIADLAEDWQTFNDFAYLLTGCNAVTFYVGGQAVLTQIRNVDLGHSVSGTTMTIAELETAAATSNGVTAVARQDLNQLLQALADEIYYRALARFESSPQMVNYGYRQQAALTPEQPPVVVAAPAVETPPTIEAAAPGKLPQVRLRAIYTPTESNFTQSSKRYLKAVDPTGDAARALKEIVAKTPTGLAHLARAAKPYPDPEKAKDRLYKGFCKVAEERGLAIEVAAQ
jgi:hypothetical protein